MKIINSFYQVIYFKNLLFTVGLFADECNCDQAASVAEIRRKRCFVYCYGQPNRINILAENFTLYARTARDDTFYLWKLCLITIKTLGKLGFLSCKQRIKITGFDCDHRLMTWLAEHSILVYQPSLNENIIGA